MLVVDVQPVGHRPVQHQVVVERDDGSEPLQEMIDARQVDAYRTVLRVNVADCLDEAVPNRVLKNSASLAAFSPVRKIKLQ